MFTLVQKQECYQGTVVAVYTTNCVEKTVAINLLRSDWVDASHLFCCLTNLIFLS